MSRRRVLAALVACALILITVIAVKLVQGDRGPGAAGPEDPGADQATVEGRTERISVPIDGTKLKGPFTQTGSRGPAISADGRYVAYVSPASNLVPGDTNKRLDVFVRDRKTQSTTRVTVPSDGTQANGDSTYPSMSADARYVAYSSNASNLVPGDTNDYRDDEDLFVWDRDTRTTTRISVASDGTRANGGSWMSSISADGRYIAYESDASNLVRGDTNKERDVFVWDRDTGTTTRVSVSSDGTQPNDESGYPSISADGRYVTYSSRAWNLVPGDSDTREDRDVFVWDREAQTTTRISVTPDGTSADHDSWHSSISADGRYIVYDSYASDLAPGETRHKKNVYLWDRETGATTRISVTPNDSPANEDSDNPSISADGRYVTYTSHASNLVPKGKGKQSDVYLWDRRTRATTRISVTPDGSRANDESGLSSISTDGRHIAYESAASNLVPNDTDKRVDAFLTRYDAFVWERLD